MRNKYIGFFLVVGLAAALFTLSAVKTQTTTVHVAGTLTNNHPDVGGPRHLSVQAKGTVGDPQSGTGRWVVGGRVTAEGEFNGNTFTSVLSISCVRVQEISGSKTAFVGGIFQSGNSATGVPNTGKPSVAQYLEGSPDMIRAKVLHNATEVPTDCGEEKLDDVPWRELEHGQIKIR